MTNSDSPIISLLPIMKKREMTTANCSLPVLHKQWCKDHGISISKLLTHVISDLMQAEERGTIGFEEKEEEEYEEEYEEEAEETTKSSD